MSAIDSEPARLTRLIELVDREDAHLLGVRDRLLAGDCEVDASRLARLLHDDVGLDRLEAFGAKFGRMQGTIVDKLVPSLLRVAGEKVLAAIDNLERMERLGLVASAEQWLGSRRLRNRLVHEYFDRLDDLAPALPQACRFTDRMHADCRAMRSYATTRPGIEPKGGG